MLTEQEIKKQYEAHFGHPMAEQDYDSFMKILDMFGIVEYSSLVDANEQIIANMRLLRNATLKNGLIN